MSDHQKFLDNLLQIQKAQTRTMKTMVLTLETHTRLLTGILEQVTPTEDEDDE